MSTGRRSASLLGVLALSSALGSCALEERVSSLGEARSSARALGFFARERSPDPITEARLAFERDARFREARFLDAVDPGSLLRATRFDQEEIDAGLVELDEIWQVGAQLFHHHFRPEEGLGGADLPFPRRFHTGFRGGPDATSCASCHWRGGIAGAGDGADQAYLQGDGDRSTSALPRDPIALLGAGYVELAAREMSEELGAQRQVLALRARLSGRPESGSLRAKGIEFGELTVRPDGSLDPSALAGVDADLVVRPFGHKGSFATLRDAIEDALLIHHGMQTVGLVDARPRLTAKLGPFPGDDPDGDGVVDEITEGQLTALTLFVAMTEVPVEDVPLTPLVPTSTLAEGRNTFEAIGCASCHTPSLELETATWALAPRRVGPTLRVDLLAEGAEPRLRPRATDGRIALSLYSDLKRHDMGESLAEPRADRGVDRALFLTRPLWGLSSSGPFLHDGRAPTVHEAILLHDGEAREARDAYLALGEPGQAPLRVFLQSLSRAPAYVVR